MLPVTRITHSADGKRVPSHFVFPRMVEYDSGLPARNDLFDPWLVSLVAAVRRMHAAGVVHLDIHPHNTLHRVLEDGRVDVLLID